MGNCCGLCPDGTDNNRPLNAEPPLSYESDPTQYKAASRDEIAAAAERRLAENKAKNATRNLRSTSAELPGPPNAGQGGLRWQMG